MDTTDFEERMSKDSESKHYDCVYARPLFIHYFMEEKKKHLPEGVELIPWTTNRSLSVFQYNKFIITITYECIEDGGGSDELDRVLNELQQQSKKNDN